MIHSYKWAKKNIGSLGKIVRTSKSLIWVDGLEGAVIGEGITLKTGEDGLIRKVGETVEVMIFSDEILPIGAEVARTGSQLKVSVGDGLLGHTIDSQGYTYDGKEKSKDSANMEVETTAVGISGRDTIRDFCETGIVTVDLVVPLGKGQRELIIGDQKTGKSYFALQTIITQAKEGSICVIGLIGKERAEVHRVDKLLEDAGVRENCIIVSEPADANAARIFISPYTAMTVAEYFRDQGRDVVVMLDDLTYHAIRYREISLIGERFPGRDSYPGDIFYVHSRLLERAGSFRVKDKTVTITCLPVAETIDGDLTGFIETNLMSMTDGHLFFDKNLFFRGRRPAVNVFLSVTRVGRQTQSKLLRETGQKILSALSSYDDLQRFLRFGPELTPQAKETIRLAEGIETLMTQKNMVGIESSVQVWMVGMLWAGLWDGKSSEQLAKLVQGNENMLTYIKELVGKSGNFEQLEKNIQAKGATWKKLGDKIS